LVHRGAAVPLLNPPTHAVLPETLNFFFPFCPLKSCFSGQPPRFFFSYCLRLRRSVSSRLLFFSASLFPSPPPSLSSLLICPEYTTDRVIWFLILLVLFLFFYFPSIFSVARREFSSMVCDHRALFLFGSTSPSFFFIDRPFPFFCSRVLSLPFLSGNRSGFLLPREATVVLSGIWPLPRSDPHVYIIFFFPFSEA